MKGSYVLHTLLHIGAADQQAAVVEEVYEVRVRHSSSTTVDTLWCTAYGNPHTAPAQVRTVLESASFANGHLLL
jgi:hypothetical protein